jgi:integrase
VHKPTLILFTLWLAQTCLSYSCKIPELLGHSSSKTTETYTQVSTKNLQQIRSPYADLGKLYTLDSGK